MQFTGPALSSLPLKMTSEIVKYVPFQSTVDPSFWMKLAEHKLNDLKLSEEPIEVYATYTIKSNIKLRAEDASSTIATTSTAFTSGRMRLDQDSIVLPDASREHQDFPNNIIHTVGKVKILNTIESFKTIKKNDLLNECCLPSLLQACGIEDTNTDKENLDALTSFFCLCHLDLKTHKNLYWFAFPVLTPATGKSIRFNESIAKEEVMTSLKQSMNEDALTSLHKAVYMMRLQQWQEQQTTGHPPFWIIFTNDEGEYQCLTLSFANYNGLSEDEKKTCKFAFLDPTSTQNNDSAVMPIPVGWTLRNLIAYLVLKLGLTDSIDIISFRPSVIRRIDDESTFTFDTSTDDLSFLLKIQLPSKEDYQWNSPSGGTRYNTMGWELNARNKPGPRSVNLAPQLEPSHLAQQASDLNLKLMKWRMIPNLDLDYLSNMRVLLLGAGTLGCSVSRTLLGWGVRNITFVDNGKVSYSNPVRQNLFEVQDCENGGKDKAVAAAKALKRIAPTIESEGYVATIPMPGHAFIEKEEAFVKEDVELMQKLVDESDVVFLLTDTRESRWLPTVMARASNKMMINAALGLDSWLVMRHGGNEDGRLGCYFCNDVVAPENSTNNRTLDQQCTVTRPGLAPIASSMAVELCVSLLHHEKKQDAPAPPPSASSAFSPTVDSSDATSALGVMPHQIRGSIVSYTMMNPTVPAFNHCTGCCDGVVEMYKKEGFDFVKRVCCNADGKYLEDIAGLTEFRAKANSMMEDCLDWDEEEADMEDDF